MCILKHYTHMWSLSIWSPEHWLAALTASTRLISGFLLDFGIWLCQHSFARCSFDAGDEVRLTVSVPVHPKGVGWGWDQCSVQAIKFFHKRKLGDYGLWRLGIFFFYESCFVHSLSIIQHPLNVIALVYKAIFEGYKCKQGCTFDHKV